MSTTGRALQRGHIWLDVVFDALLRVERQLQAVVPKALSASLPRPQWRKLKTKMKMAALTRQTCGGWRLTLRAFRELPMRSKPASLEQGVESVRTNQHVLARNLREPEST